MIHANDNATANYAARMERVLPHSIESEMCAIASMVIDPEVRDDVLTMLRADDFFSVDHQLIFGAVRDMHRAGRAVDWMLLRSELLRRNLLDEVGGVALLAEMNEAVPVAAHGAHYARDVREKSMWRQLIGMAEGVVRSAWAPHGSVDAPEKVCQEAVARLMDVLAHGRAETIIRLGDAVRETIERKTSGKDEFLKTGMAHLDELLGGLRVGGMSLVGGRPGMGKSQFLKQVVLNLARTGIPCGIVTIEEDRFKVCENYLANASNVPNNHIAYNTATAAEWTELVRGMGELDKLPIYLDDSCTDLSGVEAAAARMVGKHGCRLVVVDYLQLIEADQDREGRREGEVRKLSRGLKLLFKRLRVASLVAVQLNRAAGNDRPSMSNLRESGSIEQDGDQIILLYREDYFRQKEPGYARNNIVEAIVEKNKNGQSGVIPLRFEGEFQRITDFHDDDPIGNARPAPGYVRPPAVSYPSNFNL